jgi:hypothetical protein
MAHLSLSILPICTVNRYIKTMCSVSSGDGQLEQNNYFHLPVAFEIKPRCAFRSYRRWAIKTAIAFWNVTPRSLVGIHQHFRRNLLPSTTRFGCFGTSVNYHRTRESDISLHVIRYMITQQLSQLTVIPAVQLELLCCVQLSIKLTTSYGREHQYTASITYIVSSKCVIVSFHIQTRYTIQMDIVGEVCYHRSLQFYLLP